jgi:hypothetical protein
MKKIIKLFILIVIATNAKAQVLEDFGRVVLNTYLPEKLALPAEAKNLLATKLSQITSTNGIGGSQVNPRFIITANINVGTKDVIAGPPQLIAQNLDITLFIGDALSNTIFANTTLSLKGVGTNENKAFIDALKMINPKNKEITSFLEEGKNKIINYYISQCDFILKDADALVKQQKYAEAIYKLSLVPEVSQKCYFSTLDKISLIYQQKIDEECKVKLSQAKSVWTAAQNPKGAEDAGDILSTINPMASCQAEVNTLTKAIDLKLKADEKARWQFKMKQYADKIAAQKEQVRIAEQKSVRDDTYRENQSKRNAISQEKQSSRNFELDKIRANSYREIAVEYARNQPKTVTYNSIYWR